MCKGVKLVSPKCKYERAKYKITPYIQKKIIKILSDTTVLNCVSTDIKTIYAYYLNKYVDIILQLFVMYNEKYKITPTLKSDIRDICAVVLEKHVKLAVILKAADFVKNTAVNTAKVVGTTAKIVGKTARTVVVASGDIAKNIACTINPIKLFRRNDKGKISDDKIDKLVDTVATKDITEEVKDEAEVIIKDQLTLLENILTQVIQLLMNLLFDSIKNNFDIPKQDQVIDKELRDLLLHNMQFGGHKDKFKFRINEFALAKYVDDTKKLLIQKGGNNTTNNKCNKHIITFGDDNKSKKMLNMFANIALLIEIVLNSSNKINVNVPTKIDRKLDGKNLNIYIFNILNNVFLNFELYKQVDVNERVKILLDFIDEFLSIINYDIQNYWINLRTKLNKELPIISDNTLKGKLGLVKLTFDIKNIPNIVNDIITEIYKKLLARLPIDKEELNNFFPPDIIKLVNLENKK